MTQRIEIPGRNVVLAGATSRSQELERLAGELRRRGLPVQIVTGLEQHAAQLLQVSFRERGNAVYLLCGGPELHAAALEKIAHAVQANVAPQQCVWYGALDWANPDAMLRDVQARLAAFGLAVSTAPPTPTPAPLPSVRPGSTATMHSASVPIVTPAAAAALDDADASALLPRSALRRFVGTPVGMAFTGAAVVLIGGFGALGLASGADDPPASATEVRAAGALALNTATVAGTSQATAADQADPVAGDGTPSRLVADPQPQPAEPESAAKPEPDVVQVDDDDAPAMAPLDSQVDGDRVYRALEKQSIRAIDTLLVSPTASKAKKRGRSISRMRFDAAQAYCSDLDVDGVGGWRLPEVGEVGWLSRANIVREGVYWTATEADAFGAERIVWNAQRRRMNPTHVRWKGGRVVCVRFHRPTPDGQE